jgi:hypothetical protein
LRDVPTTPISIVFRAPDPRPEDLGYEKGKTHRPTKKKDAETYEKGKTHID